MLFFSNFEFAIFWRYCQVIFMRNFVSMLLSERAWSEQAYSSSLMCADREFWTKFYLARGIVAVRACYAEHKF
jgi:hypothetical protein